MNIFGGQQNSGIPMPPAPSVNVADIVNAVSEAIIFVNASGVIQLFNPRAGELLKWQTNDALNLNYNSVLAVFDKNNKQLDIVKNSIIQKQHFTSDDLLLKTQTGEMINADISVSSVDNGAVVVIRDITIKKQAEEEQNNFISTASHEMRTPIAVLSGYIGMILNSKTATIDQRAYQYATKCMESIEHMGNLFKDLLEITKLDDHRTSENPVLIDLSEFIPSIVNDLQSEANAKNIRLIADFDQGGVIPSELIEVDKDHFYEVMQNLIENAIKYTKQGEVRVGVSTSMATLSVYVRDSGIGIPADDLPHLFEKFYRVDSSDTREIGGTGLGLYLVKVLVDAMKGRISVQSELGVGTTFSIELPRISTEQASLIRQNTAFAQQNLPK